MPTFFENDSIPVPVNAFPHPLCIFIVFVLYVCMWVWTETYRDAFKCDKKVDDTVNYYIELNISMSFSTTEQYLYGIVTVYDWIRCWDGYKVTGLLAGYTILRIFCINLNYLFVI